MREGSLTQRTMAGLLWQGSVAGGNVMIRTLVLIILARYIPARDFGIVAAALVIATVSQVFAQIGVTKAIVQRLTLTELHVRSGFAMSLYTGVAMAGLLFAAAPLLAGAFRMPDAEPIIRLFSVLLVLNGLAAVPVALLQRTRQFRRSATIELISFALGYGVVGLVLTFAGLGIWALATAQVSQAIIRTILYLSAQRTPMALLPDRTALRELFEVGSGYSAGQMGNLVATQIDYFIVGRLLGAEPLGLYNRAYQFLMLPVMLIGTASTTVLFPSLAAIQDQPDRIARAFLRAMGVIAMITLPLSGFLMLLAPELVNLALGSGWQGMIVPFQILISTLLFRTSYKISDSISLAIGSMYERAWRQWVYAGAVAAGALVGVLWGLTGVSAGVALAVVINFLLMLHLALRLTGVPAVRFAAVYVRHALASLPVVLAASVAIWFAHRQGWSDLKVVATTTAAASFTYAFMWWRCVWIFGEDGEWARLLVLERLNRSQGG